MTHFLVTSVASVELTSRRECENTVQTDDLALLESLFIEYRETQRRISKLTNELLVSDGELRPVQVPQA